MLKGIDISNWQADCEPGKLPIDFVICKATEGLTYVSPSCDKQIQSAIKNNKLFGFYHYGRNNDPIKEADFFIKKCKGYFNKGIPILDWEEDQSVTWVNKFVKRVNEITGIWCWIYGNPWRFNQEKVEKNCGRWIAQYPSSKPTTLNSNPGNHQKTDGLVVCWQYSNNGVVEGYKGKLDLNHAYLTKENWGKYANPNNQVNYNTISTLENNDYKVTIERK
jgi:GH25 family lysozyme M1 (1,4-beta-N-acetylmuramidase)